MNGLTILLTLALVFAPTFIFITVDRLLERRHEARILGRLEFWESLDRIPDNTRS